jgi:ubiquinol-cytochrome c reductase cytochrome b subunit
VPEWYFLPFYAILRAIPSKLGGVVLMFGSLIVLFFVPWLDTSRVRSTTYRPIYRWFFLALVVDVLALGYLGAIPPEGAAVTAARVFTLYYFAHFLLVMPIVGLIETPKPMPSAISETFTHKAEGSGQDVHAVPAE